MIFQKTQKEAYTLLLSVLIVGAVGIAIAISLITLGLGSSRSSLALEQSNQAKALANACVEIALVEIRNEPTDVSTGAITLGQGGCTYAITNLGGNNRKITGSGTVSEVTRRVEVTINQVVPVDGTSWQEVADFT